MMHETQYVGPFQTHDEAYDALCALPALGAHVGPSADGLVDEPGVKFVQELSNLGAVLTYEYFNDRA